MKTDNAEQSKLAECESAIAHNLGSFRETGLALLEIRDGLLYRTTHATFEKYCQEQWDMIRRYANRLIESAQVVETLSKLGNMFPIPSNERQAHELAGLTPDDQRRVWEKAIETAPNGKITAAHIRETREALIDSPEQEELFTTLEDYRQAIADHVDSANHHHHEGKHHRREKRRHRLEAIRLRDEAFEKFGEQIELPFEFDQGN